ncbi:MAG: amidohydrolase family protein, partial [Candidatus Bipolaricaulota bacterium]|nr:amidohydrolase family protein [Candidatus Bipolaricaulota bacterium]
APVPDMISRGIRPGLGTDGYINDSFEVMRAAFLIHKGALRDPRVMPAKTVFAMGTSWGAEAIGIQNTGKIASGMLADLIGIDLSLDTPLNQENALDQVILYRSGSDVRLSIVNGRLLMNDGELLTVDIEEARHAARTQAQRLWGVG